MKILLHTQSWTRTLRYSRAGCWSVICTSVEILWHSLYQSFSSAVCAARTGSVDVDLLRSYRSTAVAQRNHDAWLWEAVRATSAAPAFFESIQLYNMGATFVDGGVRANNPIDEALKEAERIWLEKDVGLLLSLGTGIARVNSFTKKGAYRRDPSRDYRNFFERRSAGRPLSRRFWCNSSQRAKILPFFSCTADQRH